MKRNISLALQIAVYVVTILLIFFCVFWCGAIWGFSYPQYIITGGLGFLFSWFFVAFLHEMGHILFGSFFGFKVESFNIFHVSYYRKEDKPTLVVDTKNNLAGSCEIYPTRTDNVKSAYFALTIGGIFITAVLFLILSLLFVISGVYNLKPEVYPVFSFFVMWTPAAFYFTFLNAIPFTNADGKSDGEILRGILKGEASETVAVNILKIQAEMYNGFSPSQIKLDLYFSCPQIAETDPNFIIMTQLRYMYYSDKANSDRENKNNTYREDKEKAFEYIKRLESIYDEIPDNLKPSIAADMLYEYSLRTKDFERVDAFFYDALNLLKRKNAYACRVMTAYELSFERIDEAKACLDAANEYLKFEKIKGKVVYEKNELSRLRSHNAFTKK